MEPRLGDGDDHPDGPGRRRAGRRPQRRAGHTPGAAVAGRDDRHARPVPRPGVRDPRRPGRRGLPVASSPTGASARSPAPRSRTRSSCSWCWPSSSASSCTAPASGARSSRWAPTKRPRTSPACASSGSSSGSSSSPAWSPRSPASSTPSASPRRERTTRRPRAVASWPSCCSAASRSSAAAGNLLGVICAVLLLGTLRNALTLNDVSAEVLTIVTGSLLLLSVLGPSVTARVREALRRGRGVDAPPPPVPPNPVRREMSKFNQGGPGGVRARRRAHRQRVRFHQGQHENEPAAAPAATEEATPAAAGGEIKAGLKIAFLPKQINNPYFTISDKGGEDAVKAFKGEFKRVGPSDATASSQVSLHQHADDAEAGRDRHQRQRSERGRAGAGEGAARGHQGRHVRLRHRPQGP